jgi:flagellar hook protein FlgE
MAENGRGLVMTTIFSTALAGMNRDMHAIETAAQNIANVNTDGYRARGDELVSEASAAPQSRDTGAAALLDLPTSNVDLAREFVDLKVHEISYQANGIVIRIADRLLEETLNLLA